MDQLALNIVGGLIVVVLAAWLGIGAKSERVVFIRGGGTGRKWKNIIILAWLMIVLGLIVYGQNVGVGNPFLGTGNMWEYMGFDLIGLGLILLGIGKVFLWLNS